MSIPSEVIFGLLGGLVGTATGASAAFGYRVAKRNKLTKQTKDNVDTATVIHAEENVVTKPIRHKHTVLGVGTNYFDTRSPVYPPLMQLSVRIQYKPATDRFNKVIRMIDELYGMRKYFAGLNNRDTSKNADYPQYAQIAASRIDRQLRQIINFSTHDTVDPSETKRKDMHKYADDIKESCKAIVEEMTRQLASSPIYE